MKMNFVDMKKIKELGKKTALVGISTIMLATALTGCAGKTDNKQIEVSEIPAAVQVETAAPTDATLASATYDENATYEYTQEMFDAFVNDAWASLNGKINNINEEDFRIALMILNIDYLNENNPQIIIDACARGIDVERELNKMYNVLSQIREYNTSLAEGETYYSFSNLMISAKDRAVLPVLENYARTVHQFNPENPEDVERANQIFDNVLGFSKGETKLPVVIGDQLIEVAQIELTKGGVIASENIMQDISVSSQRLVSEERRAELDQSLMMRDVIAKIQEILIEKNAIAGVTVSTASSEEQAQILEQVNYMETELANEVAPFGVTQEESDALFVIANIDYFMNSTNSHNVFTTMYANGFNLDQTMELAESAVRKIEEHNLTVTNANDLYNYGHYFIESETDIISVRAMVEEVHRLKSTDAEVVADTIMDIKAYTQYSSEGYVTYQENSNGELSGPIRLDKNALDKGGNQVIDWITYYALMNYRQLFVGNEGLYDALVQYVSDRTNGLTPYDDIVLMVDDFCAENNITVYNYEVGTQK